MPIINRVGLGRNLTQVEVDGNFAEHTARIDQLVADLADKQDKLVAGPNITIGLDGRTISASGAGGATPLINDLTTGGTGAALTAQQGVVIKGLTDGLTTALTGKQANLTGVGDVPGLVTALTGKQPNLTGIADVPGLVTALSGKAALLLTGLSTASAADVVAADDTVTAFGKLQAKFNAFAASVRAVVLTGLSTADSSNVTSGDSILGAIGKLQAKFTAGIGTTYALLTDRVTYDIAGTNTSVSDALALKAPKADAVFTGTGSGVTLAGDPTSALQAAPKQYVDNLVQGLKWKTEVVAASVTNGTLATAYENGDTLDGVALSTGNRILLKDQTTQTENGIYIVNATGAPTRAPDADTGPELVSAAVAVRSGATNADKVFLCANDSINFGSTSITFTNFPAAVGALLSVNALSELVGAAATARSNIGAAARTLGRRDVAGASDTITAADDGNVIDYTNVGAIAVGIGTAFNGFSTCLTWPTSAGTITLTPTGVTLNGSSSPIVLSASGGSVAIIASGTNAFRVVGAIGDLVVADITDSGATGRSLLQAADVPTARAALSLTSGTTISASRALAAGDINKITRVDTSGGAVALTLNSATIAAGQIMLFQRNGANALTFASGTATIDNPDAITVPDKGVVAVIGSLITGGNAVLA